VLWRFENWRRVRWNASMHIKHKLNISGKVCKSLMKTKLNCQVPCQRMNAADRERDGRRPWWQPSFVAKLAKSRYAKYCSGLDCPLALT